MEDESGTEDGQKQEGDRIAQDSYNVFQRASSLPSSLEPVWLGENIPLMGLGDIWMNYL